MLKLSLAVATEALAVASLPQELSAGKEKLSTFWPAPFSQPAKSSEICGPGTADARHRLTFKALLPFAPRPLSLPVLHS